MPHIADEIFDDMESRYYGWKIYFWFLYTTRKGMKNNKRALLYAYRI